MISAVMRIVKGFYNLLCTVLFDLLRVQQYIKNAVVFIPLIFSLKIFDGGSVLSSMEAFVAFCLMSSSVYILNDIIDVKYDMAHPYKKKRLVACGLISKGVAVIISLILAVSSLAVAFNINLLSFLSVLFYLVLNIFYAFCLKNFAIVDVFCIALGFILRILAGCAAIYAPPSALVILLTLFTSMFFTFSKRKLEYNLENLKNCRKSVKEYDETLLDQYVTINAILSIAFYFTYMLSPQTVERTGSPYIYITSVPFVLIIYRLLLLVYKCDSGDDPSYFFYKDRMLQIFILIYFAVLFLILYI